MKYLSWLVLLLAACGGDDGGGGADAMLSSGTITITTYGEYGLDDVGPKAGVDVVAVNPDGSSAMTATDLDGTAELTVVEGASVAAIYAVPDNISRVHAVLGVTPGDRLTFGDPPGTALGFWTAQMQVTYDSVPGATSYHVFDSCASWEVQSPTTAVWFFQFENCAPDVYDLFLYAVNDATGDVLAYGALEATPFVTDTIVALPAWQTSTPTLSLEASGVPAQVTSARVHAGLRGESGFRLDLGPYSLTPAGGEVSTTVPWVTVGGDEAEVGLLLRTEAGTAQMTFDVLPAATASHTFADVAVLPWVTSRAIDAETSTVAIGVGSGRAPDQTRFRFYRERGDTIFEWIVMAPPTVEGDNTFVLPVLPAPYDGANLDGEGSAGGLYVDLVDYLDDDGYDDARQRAAKYNDDPYRMSTAY